MKKDYAGFWVRFFAGFLDMIFLMPVLAILLFVFGVDNYEIYRASTDHGSYSFFGVSSSEFKTNMISYAISVAYLGYFLTSKKQATFGKRILGIYVGNPDGSKLSPQKSFMRALASMLTAATLGLGFLLVIFTKEKTALHDLICNTRVFFGKKNGK